MGFLSTDRTSIQDYVNLRARIAFITKKAGYKRIHLRSEKNSESIYTGQEDTSLNMGGGFVFFLITNMLFCRDMSYQTRENDQKPGKKGTTFGNNLLSLAKTRMMKQIKLLLSKAIKEFLELRFRHAIKSLATRQYFRGTVEKLPRESD